MLGGADLCGLIAFDDVFGAEMRCRDLAGHGIRAACLCWAAGFAYSKFALMSHEDLRMDVIGTVERLRAWRAVDSIWTGWSAFTVGDRLVITAEARSYLGVTVWAIAATTWS